MWRNAERNVLIATISLSVLLTSLTIWSVAQQGRALEQRELGALRSKAVESMTHADDGLRRDIDSTYFQANLAAAMKLTGLNFWAANNVKRWPLIFIRSATGAWSRYPTETARALPTVAGEPPPQPTDDDRIAAEKLNPLAETILARLEELAPPGTIFATQLQFEHFDAYGAVLVRRALGEEFELALVTTQASLISRYIQKDPAATWELVPFGEKPTRPKAGALGDGFGRPLAQLTPAAAAELDRESRQRWRLVTLIGVATGAGWGVLIWLMARLVRQQREVVRLQRRIIADVSHELKTPLALIRLHAETLREGRVRETHRQLEYLDTITRESERLSVLLDSILDFSKIERGHHEFIFQNCDVREVLRQAWALYEPQFTSAGFDAKSEIEVARPNIKADPNAIQQVLVNLLQNAYRYSRDRKFVRLRARTEGFLILIEVEDRGIGISRDQLKELGASFVRGPDPRVREARGTGLGLAIVNRIVTAHGGKLEVRSTPDSGSTFTVWLPVDAPQAA